MRIVQFMASEKWGGAEKVFVDLSNFLSQEHEVIVLLLRGTEYSHRFSDSIKIIELQANSTTHNPLLVLEIVRLFRKIKPDIVHTHAVKASLLVKRVSYFWRGRHLATKHNARKGRIFNTLRWVSAVSAESKKTITPNENGEVRVIHNGIIPQAASQAGKNELFTIVSVGRLDAIKGFDILIEQVAKLEFPYRLSIVGKGPEYNSLQQKIQELDLEGSVRLLGFSSEIPSIMQGADLIVISSHSEGFPQVMVEALFYGKVLISTPVGGVREVLPAMFLVKQQQLAEKIDDVYNRFNSYRAHFKTLQEEKANSFHLQEIASQYENFYDTILNSG